MNSLFSRIDCSSSEIHDYQLIKFYTEVTLLALTTIMWLLTTGLAVCKTNLRLLQLVSCLFCCSQTCLLLLAFLQNRLVKDFFCNDHTSNQPYLMNSKGVHLAQAILNLLATGCFEVPLWMYSVKYYIKAQKIRKEDQQYQNKCLEYGLTSVIAIIIVSMSLSFYFFAQT